MGGINVRQDLRERYGFRSNVDVKSHLCNKLRENW